MISTLTQKLSLPHADLTNLTEASRYALAGHPGCKKLQAALLYVDKPAVGATDAIIPRRRRYADTREFTMRAS